MNKRTYNIHEAKTNLSKILQQVDSGEEIIIARAGEPSAVLSRYKNKPPKRKPGSMKGKIWVAGDWDSRETNEEIAGWFYESNLFPDDENDRIK